MRFSFELEVFTLAEISFRFKVGRPEGKPFVSRIDCGLGREKEGGGMSEYCKGCWC